jgi:hypothetical protein
MYSTTRENDSSASLEALLKKTAKPPVQRKGEGARRGVGLRRLQQERVAFPLT